MAPLLCKGDRLAIAVSEYASDWTALAVTTMPTGRWITIERRVGQATSELIRVPMADMAAAEIVSQVFPGALRTDGSSSLVASVQR